MRDLGDFPASAVIDFKWSTIDQSGASVTRATDGSIRIYKDNSTTQRTSSNGITDTEDFDSPALTGIHHLRIDTSDNTDAGFYAAGHEYDVILVGAVVDGVTINAILAHFSIERANGILALTKLIKTQTDKLTFTVANHVDSNVLDWKSSTAPAMTGDAFARLGAPAGASTAADIAALKTVADAVNAKTTNLPTDPADASDIAASFSTVNSTLATIAAYVDTEVASILSAANAIKLKTDNLPASPAATGDAMALTAAYDFAKGTAAMVEAYAANGVAPTPVQALFAIHQMLMAFAISGTSLTVKKLNGTDTAFVGTLDSATTPTALSRS